MWVVDVRVANLKLHFLIGLYFVNQRVQSLHRNLHRFNNNN